MVDFVEEQNKSKSEELIDLVQAELARINAELGDIQSKIQHSQGQLDQFRQRNAGIMAEIQRIQGALEQTPRVNITHAYGEALNSQQSLLTLQGQFEKLQEQETSTRKYSQVLETVLLRLKAPDEKGETMNARDMIIKIIDAQEAERETLTNLLHDGPAQSMTNFILQAEISERLFDRNPDRARQELATLKQKANDTFQQLRAFIFELRPMMLADLGLAPTLQRFVEEFQTKNELPIEYTPPGPMRRLEGYREALVFRGIQALMSNARENGASSISVSLSMQNEQVVASVQDNGRGLGTGQLSLDSNNPEAIGLGTLQERVTLVGGRLDVKNVAGGTRVEINIPAGPEPGISEF